MHKIAYSPFGIWIELGKFDCGKSLNISIKSNLQRLLDTELTLTVASERPKSSEFVPATIFRYNCINLGAFALALFWLIYDLDFCIFLEIPSKIFLIFCLAEDFLSMATPSSQSKQMQSAFNEEILLSFLSSLPGTYLLKTNNHTGYSNGRMLRLETFLPKHKTFKPDSH